LDRNFGEFSTGVDKLSTTLQARVSMMGRISISEAISRCPRGSFVSRRRSDFAGERNGGMLRFDVAPTSPLLATELGTAGVPFDAAAVW
jgi:hypothetical protein